MTTSFWAEIKISGEYFCFKRTLDGDIEAILSIKGYKTDDPNEEGRVIAKVILTEQGDIGTVYFDNVARSDKYAQEIIAEAVGIMKAKAGYNEVM